MIFKKDELKHLGWFYLSYFFHGISAVITPYMILYFRDLGFSFFQISIIVAAFGISVFIFEIPTGAFADSISRKYSTILGLLLIATTVILIAFNSNYYFLFAMWFLAGIGVTFLSGAYDSWVVDNLKYVKRSDLQHEYFVKVQSIMSVGMLFAPLIASYMVRYYSMSLLWLFYGLGSIASVMVLIFIPEHFKPKRIHISKVYSSTIEKTKKSFKFVRTHTVIFYLFLASFFSALIMSSHDGWQPFFINLSLPLENIGFVYSILAVVLIITPFLSRLFLKSDFKKVVIWILLISFLLQLSVIFFKSPYFYLGAFSFISIEGLRFFRRPLMSNYTNHFLPTKIRATVLSTQSMLMQIANVIGTLTAGYFMDVFSPKFVIFASAFFAIPTIYFYSRIKETKKTKPL